MIKITSGRKNETSFEFPPQKHFKSIGQVLLVDTCTGHLPVMCVYSIFTFPLRGIFLIGLFYHYQHGFY